MRWLPSISFSSSSSMKSNSSFSSSASLDEIYSSSSSSSSSSKKNDQRRRNGGFRILGPSLTRQRKLRHLSDRDVIVGPPPKSKAESGEFVVALSPSPSGYDASTRSTCSVPVPLPLPLPLPEGDADSRLPSPKQRDRGEATGDPPNVAMKSVFSGRDMRKTTENFEKRSSRMVRQHLNSVGTSPDDFMVQVPTRSAPTSPFGSPLLSPQRTGVADLFPYYYITPGGNQVWSAPEMATYDVPGLPPPAFFDYTGFSTDSSPLHSPPHRSPHRNPRSPSGPASPLHAKLSLEALTARRESNGHVNTHRESNGHIHHESNGHINAHRESNGHIYNDSNGHINAHRESNGHINVHPLPLPPGAAMPSPSAPVPQVTPKSPSAHVTQVTPKSDFLPMNNQWQKGKLIGRGTFGSVYVASNRETGALCAMKEVEIFPDDPKSAECIKQLEQEIELLSQLKHPNIVQYYGSEIVDDRFYIYLEYVHPGSINKYVHEHCGAITESVIRNFTRHILSGLAYLHSTKTIHRDIKGANLLVDASGVVKLADFGMAKHLTGQRADLSLKGSPYWMAPELMQAVLQKDNSSDLALAVDIWSLGCTIIEMLTGKPPWSEYEGAAAMFKVMRDTPPIPETLSPEGKDFLRCCFRRNPAERPSASMLLEHRFLRVSAPPDVPSCNHSFNGMKLTDKPHSPRAREIKLDQLPILPSSQRTKRGTPDCMTTGTSFMQSSFSPLKANGVIMKLPT